MKNEAAFGYEAWLCHTERIECASLHTSGSECIIEANGFCFIFAKQVLH